MDQVEVTRLLELVSAGDEWAQHDPIEQVYGELRGLPALAEVDPYLQKVMELRYFVGCSLEEIAELTGVSLAAVKRYWGHARAWLCDYLSR